MENASSDCYRSEVVAMAIDKSRNWWTGSEAADLGPYLAAYTQSGAAYPATTFRLVRCGCGSDRFRLVRALNITQRTCAACGQVRYICRDGKALHWQEAIEEDEPDPFCCIECGVEEANVCVGFAGYEEKPELDAVKWFYVGARCVGCGLLGCFNDGKVGAGPAITVYPQVTGESR
jgi:hypothetical protein